MLVLNEIAKYYVNNTQVVAGIKDISASFTIGEFVAITGSSGSGKSTLLNILAGIDDYNEGSMTVFGKETEYFDEDDWQKYRKESVSFIHQDFSLIDNFTVYQNIEIAYDLNNATQENKKAEINHIISQVGLSKQAKQQVNTLSGGQKQRVAIARALAKNTSIILADEPTGNLDSKTSNEIIELLKIISKDKLIIVVTHNIEQFTSCATRHIKLRDGKIIDDEQMIFKKNEIKHEKPLNLATNAYFKMIKRNLVFNRKSNVKFIFTIAITLLVVLMLASVVTEFSFQNYEGVTQTPLFGTVDRERLILTKQDGEIFSQDNINKLKNDTRLSQITTNDIFLDITFDLEIPYKYGNVKSTCYANTIDSPRLILSAGRMPKNYNEVILSTENGLPIDYSFDNSQEALLNLSSVDMPLKTKTIKVVGYTKNTSKSMNTIYFTREMTQDISNEFWDKYSEISITNLDTNSFVNSRMMVLLDESVENGKVYFTNNLSMRLELVDLNENMVKINLSNNYFSKTITNVIADKIENNNDLFQRYGEFSASSEFLIINSVDYQKLISTEIFQVSVFMNNPNNYKTIIKDLESSYIVIYPSIINQMDPETEYIFKIFTITLLCVVVATALIIASIILLRKALAKRNKQNTILLSLGYEKKKIATVQVIESTILICIALLLNGLLIGIAVIQNNPTINKDNNFILLSNLNVGTVVVLFGLFFLIYFRFTTKFKKIDEQTINQILKNGGSSL